MNRLNNALLPALIITALVLVSAMIVWQTRANVDRNTSATTETIAPANANSSRPFDMYVFTPGRTITIPILGMAVSLEESSMQCPEVGNTNGANANTNTAENANSATTKPCENPQYYARFKTINIQQNAAPTTGAQPGQPSAAPPTPQQNSVVFTTVPGQQIVNGHQVQLVELTQETARVLVFTATVAK